MEDLKEKIKRYDETLWHARCCYDWQVKGYFDMIEDYEAYFLNKHLEIKDILNSEEECTAIGEKLLSSFAEFREFDCRGFMTMADIDDTEAKWDKMRATKERIRVIFSNIIRDIVECFPQGEYSEAVDNDMFQGFDDFMLIIEDITSMINKLGENGPEFYSFTHVKGCYRYFSDEKITNQTCICDDCGDRVWSDNAVYIEDEDKVVCSACSSEYWCCNNCGRWYGHDCGSFDDYDVWYCQECIDDGCGDWDDENESGDGNEYHWTRNYERLTSSKVNTLTYGFELETIPKCNVSRENFRQYDDIANNVLIDHHDHDGSLTDYNDGDGWCEDGVEFVSKVFTYDYIKDHEDEVVKLLKGLQTAGYTSHNNGLCGLHFHIGYNEMPLDEDTNAKICLFVHNNWNWFKKFTRRRHFQYCGDFLDHDYYNLNKTKRIKAQIEKVKKAGIPADHCYFYIGSDSRTHTSEFRMFRGTLVPETFLASFYLLNAIIITAQKNKRLTFHNVVNKLKKMGKYDLVKTYCESRHITLEGKIVE